MSNAYNVQQAAVIGAGTMGRGIVMSLANAGIKVLWLDNNPQMLEQALAVVAQTNAHNVKLGRISAEQSAERLACVTPVSEYAALADVDLVIEAVYENLELKQQIFRTLDATLKPGAILASNTSALDIDAIAGATSRPESVLGLHFFSPAHIMKLLEIVRGAKTSPAVLEATLALGQRIGKVSVVAGNCHGFIGNRMLHTYVREARMMLLEGAWPHQIDAALQGFGFAMGPFRMYDVVGIDLEWRSRQLSGVQLPEGSPEELNVRVDNQLCEQERFGQKSGKGYYRYEKGSREAIVDESVEALIVETSEKAGFTRRDISDEEIVDRCILALVNEGAKILEEGIARNSADIDKVYLNGYGFPKERGGPMAYADGCGLAEILARTEALAEKFGEACAAAPLLKKLAESGGKFSDIAN